MKRTDEARAIYETLLSESDSVPDAKRQLEVELKRLSAGQ
jgi:hypothetical protein